MWAFDACPARRYLLVMAGLGILDPDSVVGRPLFDADRIFAVCDDRATESADPLDLLSGPRFTGPDERDRERQVVAFGGDPAAPRMTVDDTHEIESSFSSVQAHHRARLQPDSARGGYAFEPPSATTLPVRQPK